MTEVRRIGSEDGFIREFTEYRDRVKSLETAPAGNIVVRETLTTEDPDTGVKTILGQLPDGSYGIQPFIGDIVPPPVASVPVVSAEPGSFVVAWDGLFVAGELKPRDFEHVNVVGHKMSGATTLLSVIAGVIRINTESVIVSTDVATIGETWQFSFESVDFNGNTSARSSRSASVVMQSISTDQGVTDAIAAVQTSANAAQTTANTAQTAAATAQTKADQAFVDAATAAGIANGKGKVLAQNAAPAVADQNANTLWIDTTAGANTPKRWSGSAWVVVTDKAATDAATAAATAQTRADQAFNSATSAATAAGTAQTSADSKNRVWYQTTAPAGSAHKNGDTWFDTDDGNRIYLWTGSAWTDYRDAGIDAAQTSANTAQTAANGKNKINYQTTMPAGGVLGDTWFDTDDGNKIYVHNGTTFVNAQDATIAAAQSTANTKTKTFVQGTAPTATTQGDIWIDTANGNVIKTWEGSAWVTRPDAAIAAAQTAANTAQTAANGKNKVYYQTAMPTGGTYILGDTWFDTDDGNKIYVHNGTTFTASALGASAIADLAITNAKIADATIQSAKIGSVDAGTITVGTLDADRIAARAISVDKLNIGSVDNLISEPTFLTGGSQWLLGGAFSVDPTGARNGGPAWKIVNAASLQGTYNKPDRLRAEGGQSYRVMAWVKSDVAIPVNGVSLYITTRNSAGTSSVSVAVGGNVAATAANTWVSVSGTRTLPADAIDVSFGVFSQTAFSTGNLWVDFVSATRMATGELIVDGAIQAGSAIIGTGAIGTAQIANLAVTDAQIAAATITSAKIANLDAAKITSGTIDADRIGVATLTADKVIVGTGNNLAYNGSAEIAASTKGYSSFTRTTTEVPPGFGAAWQSAPVQATVNFLTDPAVPVKPQTRYKLNVWVKADKAGSVVYLEPMTGSVAGGNRTNPIYAFSNAAVPTVWTKWSVEFTTGLSSTNTLYFRWFLNHVNGTVFDSVFSFTGFTLTEMNAGELIVDGSIKTNHMTAGTIDASILTASSITAPKIAAKSITTDKLVISSTDNLVVGADFSNTAASWQQSANIIYQATGGRGATTALRFTGSVAALTSLNLTNRVTVEPDNRFRCSVFVKSSAALAIDKVRLNLRCYTTATAYTDIIGCSNVAALVAATWTQVKGISPTLPAGTIAVEFYLSITNPATGTTTDVDYASATRAFDGNLVVDGAIDGQTITGATVQTAATGARIVLDQTSLNAWNTAGDNYFNMSNATGVNISSVGAGGFDVTRINYCTNPSFEVDISGWTSAQTIIRDTAQFYVGTASLKATHTATADRVVSRKQSRPVTNDYTVSSYVRHNGAAARNMRMNLYYTDLSNVPVSGGTFTGSTVSVPPNTWTRLTVTDTGLGWPGTASNVRTDVVGVGFTSAETMWVDAVMWEALYNVVNAYFDGSTTASGKLTYVWEGTSGLSYSDQRTDRDIKIKTGGNDVLLPGNQFSKQAVGIGFIPLTPYTQTAGLFSDGQVVSLIEGASDPQLTRLDLGNQKINTWSYGETTIQARGRIYVGSTNGSVDLWGGSGVSINGTAMVSKHVELTTGSGFTVAGGNAAWDIGTLVTDVANSVSDHSNLAVPGPLSGTVQVREAGYYQFSAHSLPRTVANRSRLLCYIASGSQNNRVLQQQSTDGYFWELSVTTPVVYLAANDYVRFQANAATQAVWDTRVWVHKMTY